MRVVLLGNAGAGKTTMSRRLIGERGIARLSLDEIAWDAGATRKPLAESRRLLDAFLAEHQEWVIEGCYSDLVEAALPHCTELRFLNPGVETCVAHGLRRPWEPEKFASQAEQTQMLNALIEWVRQYETRADEYGLKRHRAIFDSFTGPKREYRSEQEADAD